VPHGSATGSVDPDSAIDAAPADGPALTRPTPVTDVGWPDANPGGARPHPALAAPAAPAPADPAPAPRGTVDGSGGAPPAPAAPADPTAPVGPAPAAHDPAPPALPVTPAPLPQSARARIGFNHHDLDGWTVTVHGGTEPGKGSVRPGSALLHEGDSFLVGLERAFVMPERPAPLVFSYTDLAFDTSDPDSVNDAFEASVVDAQGHPLVHPFVAGRDAFFNVTEGVGLATGPSAAETGDAVRTVTLDMAGVLPGTEATLRFRLVNNDQDTGTQVRILDVFVPTDNLPPELGISPAAQSVQYSDPVQPVTIAATDDHDGPLTIRTFYSVDGGELTDGLPNGLALDGSGGGGTGTWTVSGIADLAPADYRIRAAVTDADGETSTADATISVAREDAAATYSGAAFVATRSVNESAAVVPLRATVRDVTAVDPAADPHPGDVRHAIVSFVDRDTGAVIASGLPVTLLDPADPKSGVVAYDWAVDLGNADSRSFTLGVVVAGTTRGTAARTTSW
jgi:hypothetical protein